jgi:hypothetical protein
MRDENSAPEDAIATKSNPLQEYRVLKGEIMQHKAESDDLPLVCRKSVAPAANGLARNPEFSEACAYLCQESLLIVDFSRHKMRVLRSMRNQRANS